MEKELVSIPAMPGLHPQPRQGSQQSLRKGKRLPAELKVGKTKAGREHSPRRVLQRCKTQHSSPVGG